MEEASSNYDGEMKPQLAVACPPAFRKHPANRQIALTAAGLEAQSRSYRRQLKVAEHWRGAPLELVPKYGVPKLRLP
jgi:hypothetical protein